MSFVINQRYVLLTYSQCSDLDPFAVVDVLSGLGAECIVARERHSDGGTHLHAFVDFGRKFRSRRTDILDVDGFHPNISPSRGNPAGGYDYATKDGDIVAGGLARPDSPDVTEGRNPYAEICMAETRDDFWDLVTTLAPRMLLANFNSLSAYADWKYRVDPEPYVPNPEHTFNLEGYPELDRWATQFTDWDASVSGESPERVSHPSRSRERRPSGPFPWRSASPCSSGLAWRRRRELESVVCLRNNRQR